MAEQQPTAEEIKDPYNLRTFKEKADYIAGLAFYPALTLMVFLRIGLGYRLVKPHILVIMAVIIVSLPSFAGYMPADYSGYAPKSLGVLESARGHNFEVTLFAVLMVICGLYQRRLRWVDLNQGRLWHSYSRGGSWLRLLLPRQLPEHIIHRFIDPLACYIVGLIAYNSIAYLGWWLMMSAVCLLFYEAWAYQKAINSLLDMQDGLCESEEQRKEIALFSSESNEISLPTRLEESAGIPTGLAPDIQAHIQKRRLRKPPPDDFV